MQRTYVMEVRKVTKKVEMKFASLTQSIMNLWYMDIKVLIRRGERLISFIAMPSRKAVMVNR